jgi:hypothetical protein
VNDIADEIGKRLRSAALKKEIVTPRALAQQMTAAGFAVTTAGVKKHWYGKVIPNGTTCIGYREVLGVTLDWLLAGVSAPQKITRAELLDIVGSIFESEGGTIPAQDPTIVEAAKLLMKIKDEDTKAAVLRMLRAFSGDHGGDK